MKRGKKYTNSKKEIKSKLMSVNDALDMIKTVSTAKFDGKIEIHVALNLNEKERKQLIRGSVIYDKSFSKRKKILVFSDQKGQEIAKNAGADYYGLEDMIEKIKGGWLDFDIAIATPNVMAKIAILGRVLGTKGLMPNPKNNTVTEDIEGTIEIYRKGKIDYKADETGVIHSLIGNSKSEKEDLRENTLKLIKSILQNSKKSQSLLFKSIYLSPTMGPSIKVQIESILKEL